MRNEWAIADLLYQPFGFLNVLVIECLLKAS